MRVLERAEERRRDEVIGEERRVLERAEERRGDEEIREEERRVLESGGDRRERR